ncbi:unnamed protein product [Microthlaspi erraticum]|uniref:F-box domain-containing protein n=1 Tax=Microthlaspi erraticum TaxID=1685480 RepID=A0A6D2LHS8_9BRAS|nr:unnamed protein product [Microthlaspi erraticum]
MGLSRIDPEIQGCQRICDLPNDLLLRILHLVPAKDAVATEVLSKRWRHVWKMMHKLDFIENQDSESFGRFIDKALQLHKAPKLRSLVVEVGPRCPVDVDVRKWADKAVNQGVMNLEFKLHWRGEPTSFPKSVYTCDTLVRLCLSNQVLVDVSFTASLPSLTHMFLFKVVYKDQDSLARLLSSCPLLYHLSVERHKIRKQAREDNLTDFTVKVPWLKSLRYYTSLRERQEHEQEQEQEEYQIGSLVIDCPALTRVVILEQWGDYCSVTEKMLCLEEAYIRYVHNPDEKLLTCFSSARRLVFSLSKSTVACCKAVKFSGLIDLEFIAQIDVDWLEPFILLLHNSPKLKILTVDTAGCPQSPWNEPSTVPGCLSSHLEVVKWKDYEGKEDEKQLLTYILANSYHLKTVEVLLVATCNLEECQKELESMPRISTSSRLLCSTSS